MELPLEINWELNPVKYRQKVVLPEGYIETSLEKLCKQAEIPLCVTAPPRKLLVYFGSEQIRTKDFDLIGIPVNDLTSKEAAFRALEALAHSFHDHVARACVCGKGYFYS